VSIVLSAMGRLALDAARQGAGVVAAARTGHFAVRSKSSYRDLVTDIDTAAERAVTAYIRQHRPTDPILAEESGEHEGAGKTRWIIDPIDGTANFVHNRPDYAVAVAAEIGGRIMVGAIVKPATGEWIACDERGIILLNEGTASVSHAHTLDGSLISLSVSINEKRRPLTLSTLARLLPEVQDFRRTGSTSCDLFAVATGALDAYIGIGSNAWDIASGWAVVGAAGGSCLRFPVAGGQEAFVLGAPDVTQQIASIVTEHAAAFAVTRGLAAPGQRRDAAVESPGIAQAISPRPSRDRLHDRNPARDR
jgi:myo-inositol-1(or 4)-monophosphatase